MNKLNVLLITGHFPPERSVGANRPYSLFKYLNNDKMKVFVLTRNTFGYLPNEENIIRVDSSYYLRRSNISVVKLLYKIKDYILCRVINDVVDSFWKKKGFNKNRSSI